MAPLKFCMLCKWYVLIILRWENQFCRVTNSEEVACKGEGSKELVHSDDIKASSEKTDVNGPGRYIYIFF